MNKGNKFDDNHLPPIKAFYSELNLLGTSKCDYDPTQRVWREFGMNDLGDYYDVCLASDEVSVPAKKPVSPAIA